MTRKIKYLSREETEKILSEIKKANNKRDVALYNLMYRYGLRVTEPTLLKLSDLNFDSGRIYIHRLKGSVSCEYRLPEDLFKMIKSYIRSRGPDDRNPYLFVSKKSRHKELPISQSQIRDRFKHYARMVGIPKEKCFIHTLKHSSAVHMLEAGVDIRTVQDVLGHKDIRSTTVYATVTSQMRDNFIKRTENEEIFVKV